MFPRPVMVRRRRPLLRAAVVGGGAYMAGRATANRANAQAERAAGQDERLSALEEQQQASAVPPPAGPPQAGAPQAGAQADVLDQLTRLNDLHEKGALTDTEFTQAKSRLLGGTGGSRP